MRVPKFHRKFSKKLITVKVTIREFEEFTFIKSICYECDMICNINCSILYLWKSTGLPTFVDPGIKNQWIKEFSNITMIVFQSKNHINQGALIIFQCIYNLCSIKYPKVAAIEEMYRGVQVIPCFLR